MQKLYKTEGGILLSQEQAEDIAKQVEAQRQDKPYELEFSDFKVQLYADGEITTAFPNSRQEYFKQGNLFETAKEAERERDYRALNMRITQFIARENKRLDNWVCDWKDNSQIKHLLEYNHGQRTVIDNYTKHIQSHTTARHFHLKVLQLLRKAFSEAELISWARFGEV